MLTGHTADWHFWFSVVGTELERGSKPRWYLIDVIQRQTSLIASEAADLIDSLTAAGKLRQFGTGRNRSYQLAD